MYRVIFNNQKKAGHFFIIFAANIYFWKHKYVILSTCLGNPTKWRLKKPEFYKHVEVWPIFTSLAFIYSFTFCATPCILEQRARTLKKIPVAFTFIYITRIQYHWTFKKVLYPMSKLSEFQLYMYVPATTISFQLLPLLWPETSGWVDMIPHWVSWYAILFCCRGVLDVRLREGHGCELLS